MGSKLYQIVTAFGLAVILTVPFANYAGASTTVKVDGRAITSNTSGYYKNGPKIEFDASDARATATLNGAPISSGIDLPDDLPEGKVYTLAVNAPGGSQPYVTYYMAFDRIAPMVNISGVADGQLVNHSVRPSFSTNEGTPTATINGAPFNSGTLISTDGIYTMSATSTDQAGNIGNKSIVFQIDTTSPVISVAGVANGGSYNGTRTITYSVSEGTVWATLNGYNFTSGSQVYSVGTYTLIVNARDDAGNTATKTIRFTISSSDNNKDNDNDDNNSSSESSSTTVVNKFFRTVFGSAQVAQATVPSTVSAESDVSDQDLSNIKVLDIFNAKDITLELNSCDNIRIIGTAKQGMLVILYLKRDGSDIPTIGFVKASVGDKWEFTTDVPLKPGKYTIYLKGAVDGGKVGPMLVGDTFTVEGCSWWVIWLWIIIIALLAIAAALGGWLWYKKNRKELEEKQEEDTQEVDQEIISSRL